MKMCGKGHGEWSPLGSPAAKILGVCGPSVFGLGTSHGTPFTIIPPRLFHTLSQDSFYRLAIFNCATFILSCHNTDIVQYAALQYTSVLNVVRPASWWPIFISMCLLRKLIETCRHCMTLLRKNTETCRPCSAIIQRHVDLAPQKNGDVVLELQN